MIKVPKGAIPAKKAGLSTYDYSGNCFKCGLWKKSSCGTSVVGFVIKNVVKITYIVCFKHVKSTWHHGGTYACCFECNIMYLFQRRCPNCDKVLV